MENLTDNYADREQLLAEIADLRSRLNGLNDQREKNNRVEPDVSKETAIQKALEKSCKRFRLLVDNIQDVLWVTDVEFNPTYVTPSIKKLSGYTQEEFLAMPVKEHLLPRYRRKFDGLHRMMASLIKNKEEIPAKFFRFECRRKDGKVIWVEIITAAMLDSDGSLEGFTGVIRDSTDRVQEQQELELAKEVALAASRTKSEFLANMSHEIRTPMNGVLGILQLLKSTSLDPQQKKYVEMALNSGTSLLNLISDILDFSKIEAGKIDLKAHPLVPEQLLQSVVVSFESLIDREKVTICCTVDKSVPKVVLVDGSRLKQILFNLVGNAVKFTERGRIDIALSGSTVSADSMIDLEFSVSDSGRGIAVNMIDCLFEPFVQEDGTFRRKYGGTGLGLSIVKQLVEKMDGKVELQSTLGQGTVVRFRIRAGVAKDDPPQVSTTESMPPAAIAAKQILVVEDEKINALVISAMLGKMGHEVHLAVNGLQALQKIKELAFDCIFMDIQMPELDGVETTRLIRSTTLQQSRKIPVIALTAHAMKGDRERFLSAGMDDYLAKPVEIDGLKEVLSRLQEQGFFSKASGEN